MKKKRCIILIGILLIALLVTIFAGGFHKGLLFGKIYRPQNVYEEIWNLVIQEQRGTGPTVLTATTQNAVVDYDFGVFVAVQIPACNVAIAWEEKGAELLFLFGLETGGWTSFIYNYKTKTLFGDMDLSYLMENFLADYFAWCENNAAFSSGYATDALGDFTFQYVNPIWKRKYENS